MIQICHLIENNKIQNETLIKNSDLWILIFQNINKLNNNS